MTDPYSSLLTGITRAPVQTDPTLPACPVCGAPAIEGYLHRAWSDLAHDCNCVLESEPTYFAGLRRIWRRANALPHFVDTLPERYRAYTLDSLRATDANREPLAAVRAGLNGNLYLYGPAGTGKTHLAVAAGRQLASQGHTARLWGMAALFKALRDSFSHDDAPRPELHHWDVLILDDIDKLKPSQYVYETFYELIEARWANKKITIFTAQQDADQAALSLTPVGSELAADPLASRMASGVLAHIQGEDARFKQDGGRE